MQSINIAILNPLFLLVLSGSTLSSLLLGGFALVNLQYPGAIWHIAGAVLFGGGVILVTAIFNVPLNNVLADVDPEGLGSAIIWEHYLEVWTRWNHLRTLSAISATGSFMLSLTN